MLNKKISIMIAMCAVILSACSKQPDFDAKFYVQSSLDAYYHGEYKDYAVSVQVEPSNVFQTLQQSFTEKWKN